jgi:hypothetical protein
VPFAKRCARTGLEYEADFRHSDFVSMVRRVSLQFRRGLLLRILSRSKSEDLESFSTSYQLFVTHFFTIALRLCIEADGS